MARKLRYNPPPNWPPAPRGWKPEIGWQPDPAWGPAPPGWKLWDDRSWRRRHPFWSAIDITLSVLLLLGVVAVVINVGVHERAAACPGNSSTSQTHTICGYIETQGGNIAYGVAQRKGTPCLAVPEAHLTSLDVILVVNETGDTLGAAALQPGVVSVLPPSSSLRPWTNATCRFG